MSSTYETVEVTTEKGRVGLIRLNRPKQLNALNQQVMAEVVPRRRVSTPIRRSGPSC